MQPTAVLLDFDGVLVDSLKLHLAAWRAAAVQVFGVPLTEEASLAGYATRTIAHILCKRYGAPGLTSVLTRAKEDWLSTRFAELPLLPGSAELIAALASAGLPYGVASNSSGRFVRGALAHHGLKVPVVVTSSEISRPKPAPDIYWDCANQLGIATGQRGRILVFEDSPHGLKAAVAAGMIAIGVASERPAAKLRAAGAVAVCAHLGEALALGWLRQVPTA